MFQSYEKAVNTVIASGVIKMHKYEQQTISLRMLSF